MRLLLSLFSLAALPSLAYAQYPGPQGPMMFSRDCAHTPQYGTSVLCYDTVAHTFYYWNTTVFSPITGGDGCTTSGTSILKGNNTGGCANATSGADYQAPIAGNTLSAHNFANSISTAGAISGAQPAFADISGNISTSQMNSGNGASGSTFWRGDATWQAVTASAGGSSGNPQYSNGGTIGGVSNVFYVAPGAISSSTFSSNCGSNPCVIEIGPGNYTVAAPLTWGTSHDQTLLCNGAHINCTDTTGGQDCLDEDVHGHFVGTGPGDGGANDGCMIADSSTANITSLISNASKTAADGFDLRNVLLDPNTSSTITKGELWLSGAEGFNTVSNVKMTQPPVGGSNSGIEYAVDDAGGTRQWNQIDNFAVSVTCGGAAGATGISITATTGGGGSNFTFNGGSVVDCGASSTYVNIAGNSSVQPKNIHFIDTYFEPDGSGDFIDINDAYAVTFDNVYFNQANASTMTNCVDIKGTAGNVGIVKVSGRAAPSACTNVIDNEINGYTKTAAGNLDYTYPGTNGAPIRVFDGPAQYDSFGPRLYYSAAGTAIPSCASSLAGQFTCVSDSTACTSGTTYTSGGSTACLLQCNNAGSAWKETGINCF